jgi:acyl-coenzyme A thioesterase PaaI-like protein
MDLRIDYLRPSPSGERVYGRGICYHLTNSIGFVRGFAHNGNPDEPLAHASGTFIRIGDRIS